MIIFHESFQADQFPLASIYFVIFILIGAFILINLVVAVVVTNLVSFLLLMDIQPKLGGVKIRFYFGYKIFAKLPRRGRKTN